MNKILLAILTILPLSWAGATWLTSNKTEAVLDNALMHSNQKIAEDIPFIKIEKQSFDKGFMTSQAKSTLGLDPEIFEGQEPIHITLNHTIYHGPLMMTPNGIKTGSSYILTTIDQELLSAKTKEVIQLLFDDNEPLQLGMHTGMGSKVDLDLDIAAIHLDSDEVDAPVTPDGLEKMLMDIDGVTGQFSTNDEGSWLKGSINFGAMKIIAKDQENDINLDMDAAMAELDFDEIYRGSMLVGATKIEVPEFTISEGDDRVTLSGLSIQSSAKETNGSLDGVAVIDVDKLLVKSTDLPADFPESSVHLSIGLKGLEREAVIKLIDTGHDLSRSQNAALKGENPNESVEDMMKAMVTYFEAVGNLLSKGTESNNVIRISNEKGSSELALDMSYAESKKLFELATVRDVIMALQGVLKLNIDKSMVSDLPADEGLQMTMGLIKDTGEAYETVAVLDGGEVKVNGEPVPVLDMLGPMLDQPLPWQAMQGMME